MSQTTIKGGGVLTAKNVSDLNANFTDLYGSTAGGTLTSAHLLVGNASNVATDTAVTGDVTITNAGVTAIKTSVTLTTPVLSGTVTGTYNLAGTPTITSPTLVTPVVGVATGTSLAVSGLVTSTSASAGIGYATGAGGAGTQGTNRTTTVVMSPNPCLSGSITLFSAAGSATPASFAVTNSAVAATDTIIVNQKSGTDKYEIFVTAVGTGSFTITSFTTGGTTTEAPVFNFAVLKAVAS